MRRACLLTGLLLSASSLLAACTASVAGDDAGAADAPSGCSTDLQCSDGLFCNGLEVCRVGSCVAGALPCGAGMRCIETLGQCQSGCATPDGDGDGVPSSSCGGTDCDDTDPNRYPGAVEVCDPMHRDEDCDPSTFGRRDADGDGAIDAACCNSQIGGGEQCGTDCNDAAPTVGPTSPEVCNATDDDCDGAIDETVLVSWWPDADRDTYGDASASATTGCVVPSGSATRAGDCDDTQADVFPGRATDPCDGIDQDCDGTIDQTPCATGAACVTPADGSAPRCRVLRCAASGSDCDGDATNGCEQSLCDAPTGCGACGVVCASCVDGSCTTAISAFSFAGSVVDGETGANIDGADVEGRARCATRTTSRVGSFGLSVMPGATSPAPEVRVDHVGYRPGIAQLSASVGVAVHLFTDAHVAAWQASAPWTTAAHTGLVVVDAYVPMGSAAPPLDLAGAPHAAPITLGTGVLAGSGATRLRVVFPNVAPGTVRVGAVPLASGMCGLICDRAATFYLDEGAVGYLETACSFACRP